VSELPQLTAADNCERVKRQRGSDAIRDAPPLPHDTGVAISDSPRRRTCQSRLSRRPAWCPALCFRVGRSVRRRCVLSSARNIAWRDGRHAMSVSRSSAARHGGSRATRVPRRAYNRRTRHISHFTSSRAVYRFGDFLVAAAAIVCEYEGLTATESLACSCVSCSPFFPRGVAPVYSVWCLSACL